MTLTPLSRMFVDVNRRRDDFEQRDGEVRSRRGVVRISGPAAGSLAVGDAIGSSGARILTTLLYALEQQGLKRGIAALCIGGGEATAIALERL